MGTCSRVCFLCWRSICIPSPVSIVWFCVVTANVSLYISYCFSCVCFLFAVQFLMIWASVFLLLFVLLPFCGLLSLDPLHCLLFIFYEFNLFPCQRSLKK